MRAAIRMTTVREAVEDGLEARIDAETGEDEGVPDEIHDLYDALDERLSDPKDKDDFTDLPISELIARVCRDLGMIPDWSLWEEEDWAIEEAEARTPGSPYAPAPFGGGGVWTEQVSDPGDARDDPPP